MPGTEAQQAYDLLEREFPAMNADGATARVVFHAESGRVTDSSTRGAIEKTVRELEQGPQVRRVTDPLATGSVSEDGSTAYAQVTYGVAASELEDGSRSALADTVSGASSSVLSVEVGGNAVEARSGGHAAEAVGLMVAAVVLVLTFGSLLAAGLPLLTAVVGVGVGALSIRSLAEPLNLGSTTTSLAVMIGLAVGVDYALLVVSRYRAELAGGRTREQAAGHAVGTAGSAVVFAGLTVVIALAGLSVVGIPLLTQMGLAAAGTVVIAVVVAVTLIPALLGMCGGRIGPARGLRRPRRPDGALRVGMGVRWGRFVVRRPVAVLLVAGAALGVVAVPAASLEMGLPGDEAKSATTTQRRAYDMVAEGFGPGYNGPLTVVVEARSGSADKAARNVAGRIEGRRDVAAVGQVRVSASGETAVLNVVPAASPSSARTTDLVHALRESDLVRESDAHVLVTGTTAMNVDVSQKLSNALVPYLALVVGLAFVVLIAVFRSLLVPLKAAVGFLLSVLAGLGAVVAVFQWGWLGSALGVTDPGPVVSIMPILMVGVVFGLAMDYEVFLVTRMREAYVRGQSPKDCVVSGFEHSARVVTAAAVIMISVFAAFLGSDEPILKTIGFGLAASVFLDAFVVRMTLVPAVLALLGRRAWSLPRWLDRITPDLDVEGARLERDPEAGAAESPGTVLAGSSADHLR
ncbi:MMPL family transporter [Streptomyces youssoufiensis]